MRRVLASCLLVGCGPKVASGDGSSDETAAESTSTTTSGGGPTSSSDTTASSDVSSAVTTAVDTTTTSTTNDDDTVGPTTGVPEGDCSQSVVLDGGFEAGTPSRVWAEQSDLFGTPICDDDCTRDPGASSYAGEWYVWFGGVDDEEHAMVAQDVVIDGPTAFLRFHLDINTAAGTGDDTFEVTIDGQSVFFATDFDMPAFDGYQPISIDVTDLADGQAHDVRFAGDFPGTGLSNFFLDEVSLVSCTPDPETTGTSGSSGSTSSSSTETGTSTGSDSGGTSSGT